ncbi:MAG TPA: DUF4249 domain-containing protein [Prolixibacteraceae bacterium]|jgi:hypothetical protein
MRKELIYFCFLILLFTSCEERYNPTIDSIDGQLVVEAMAGSDPSHNFVHLTKTNSFYSEKPAEAVAGAFVSLLEPSGTIIRSTENNTGYFTFQATPKIGRNYKLQILLDGETYESEFVTMPPTPSITNFYTGNIETKEYVTDGYGAPVAITVRGRELYVDAPVTAELSNYRFSTRAVLQWSWSPRSANGPPPPPHFGWESHYPKSVFNIAGRKEFSQNSKIEKHPLMTLPYNAKELYLKPDSTFNGWIMIIDQYGTSKGSYDYHEKLNSQFEAEGSLFDPVQTQIYGNIKCITDPSKIAFGYFDLNSYRQYRYFIYSTSPESVILRQIFRYPYISEEGETVSLPPDFWE